MSGLQMKYFVLKPHGRDAYAQASRAALRRYADSIRAENENLADDLIEWLKCENDWVGEQIAADEEQSQ